MTPPPLRLWPGVVAAVLLVLARFGLKAVIPGFKGFALAAQAGFAGVALVLLWWLFFSRAAWWERLGGLALMVAGLGAAWALRHGSMGPLWLFVYAVPLSALALVIAAVATRRLPGGPRRLAMAGAIVLATVGWTMMRTEGISGDHVARFGWRWTRSAEERLVAWEQAVPVAATPTPAASPMSHPPSPGAVEPKAPAAERPEASAPAGADGGWPGFRGPQRDGAVRGVRIETDWTASPPVELWRRPVGPAWSSFAVRGDLLYTQEQHGEDEVVACYRLATGEPVWTHRDAARFFESNAGAGPRGTPTLVGDRVYSFGATGILNALGAADGALAWSRNVATETGTPVPYWGFSSSPLPVDGLVVVAAAGQLVAYDRGSGERRWAGPASREGYSSPQLATIAGVTQILLLNGHGGTSVAPADGTVLWQHAWKGLPIIQPAVLAEGGVLISNSADGGTRRLAVSRGAEGWTVAERWTSLGLKPYFNDFVVHRGHAYGFDGRILACIDLQDGARKWKGGRYGNGQLVLLPDQDVLLVLSEEGELALVRAVPDGFTELARLKAIEGKTWNHPVLAGHVLLVRNGEEMVAFRLSPAVR